MLEAEDDHRRHATSSITADPENGPLAHLPSGRFNANSAWLVMAAMAFNLTRAAGALASLFHAGATTATIRSAHQRSRPSGPFCPSHPPATTDELALGRCLARAVHRRTRTTGPTRTDGEPMNGFVLDRSQVFPRRPKSTNVPRIGLSRTVERCPA